MSNIKIYYHQYHSDKISESPFSLDGVGFKPEMVLNNTPKTSVYYDCPAWKHKATRTFQIRSPIDLKLKVDREREKLQCVDWDLELFSELTQGTFVPGWCSDNITIQFGIPQFLFWTNHKNVWIEIKPHAESSIKNNISVIPAWFNMSNWTRPVGFAFNVVKPLRPVNIKRGDVIYEVCFYSKNLNDGVILEEKEFPKELEKKVLRMSMVKNLIPGLSQRLIFKNKESKCPFNFMWK